MYQSEAIHSVHIINLTFRTTTADLMKLFDKFGPIGDVHIPKDFRTGESKGFGFVRFFEENDMQAALSMDGTEVDGRVINVSKAQFAKGT